MSLFTFIAPQESGLAHTLPVSCVTDSENLDTRIWYEKTHESGWTITANIVEDYYAWINEFEATHPVYGSVKGDFDILVIASSEIGLVTSLKIIHMMNGTMVTSNKSVL